MGSMAGVTSLPSLRVPNSMGAKVSMDAAPFESLGEALMALGGRLTRLQTEILAGLDQPLTIRQYRILSRVGAGHTSLTALSRLAHRNLSTMSESVDKLVKQGFLTRGTDDTSRRVMHLALTTKGKNARDAADRALEKFTAALTAGISPELQRAILPALTDVYLSTQSLLDER